MAGPAVCKEWERQKAEIEREKRKLFDDNRLLFDEIEEAYRKKDETAGLIREKREEFDRLEELYYDLNAQLQDLYRQNSPTPIPRISQQITKLERRVRKIHRDMEKVDKDAIELGKSLTWYEDEIQRLEEIKAMRVQKHMDELTRRWNEIDADVKKYCTPTLSLTWKDIDKRAYPGGERATYYNNQYELLDTATNEVIGTWTAWIRVPGGHTHYGSYGWKMIEIDYRSFSSMEDVRNYAKDTLEQDYTEPPLPVA